MDVSRFHQPFLDLEYGWSFEKTLKNIERLWDVSDRPKYTYRYQPLDPSKPAILKALSPREDWEYKGRTCYGGGNHHTFTWCPNRECWFVKSEWVHRNFSKGYRGVKYNDHNLSEKDFDFSEILNVSGIENFTLEQINTIYEIVKFMRV